MSVKIILNAIDKVKYNTHALKIACGSVHIFKA